MSLLTARPVVLITGVSAAGKSTVGEALARRFEQGVHVRGDVFRRMVVTGRAEIAPGAGDEAWNQLLLRYRLAASTADAYHEAGFAVVVQDVIIGRVLQDVVEMIRSRPLVVVVLCPSPEAVAAREAGRNKVAYRAGGHSTADLDSALRDETPRIGLWLDTTELSVDDTVDAIIDRGLSEGSVH